MIVKKNTLAFWSGLEYRDPPFLNRVYLVPESSNKVYSRDTPNSEYAIGTKDDGRKFRTMASDVFTLVTEPKVHPIRLTCNWKVDVVRGDNRIVLVTWGGGIPDSDHVANTGRRSFGLTTHRRIYASTFMAVHPNDILGWRQYFSVHQLSCTVIYKGITYDAEARNIEISRPKWDYWWDYWV